MTEEELPSLSLGTVVGGAGPATQTWRSAVKRVMDLVAEVARGHDSPLAVNVVYYIPGEHFAPDFVGVRTGRSRRDPPALMVQVALPSDAPADPGRAVFDRLVEAVGVAESFAWRRQIGGPEGLEELRKLLGVVAARLEPR